jgi:hypothetical protein
VSCKGSCSCGCRLGLQATRELAGALGVDQLALLRANRDRAWAVVDGEMSFASVRPGDVFRLPHGGEVEVAKMGHSSAPLRVPRLSMLAGLSDFQAFDQPGSAFDTAWKTVANQVSAETGGDTTAIQTAASDFSDSYQQLISSAQGFQLDDQSALNYAQQYVMAGRTIAGAVEHVQGLIAAAQGASTPAQVAQVFNLFTGTLIGAVTAAGVVSAGVGSLIVAGAGVVYDLLASSGLLGTPSSGVVVCQSGGSKITMSNPPTVQVGCAASASAPVVAQGAANWRKFPSPKSGLPGDASWFLDDSADWYGDPWVGWSGFRLLDSAFPQAHYMNCAQVPSELASFNQAFAQAWIANAEYALNGLKAQEDAEVLVHAVRIWNRAHDGSTYYDLTPAPSGGVQLSTMYAPTLSEIAAGKTSLGGPLCSPDGKNATPLPYYGAQLMTRVRDLYSSNDTANNMVSGNLRINTGSPKVVYQIQGDGNLYKYDLTSGTWTLVLTAAQAAGLRAAIEDSVAAPAGASSSSSAGTSTGAKIAIGAAVVASAAGAAWLGLGRPMTVGAASTALRAVFR